MRKLISILMLSLIVLLLPQVSFSKETKQSGPSCGTPFQAKLGAAAPLFDIGILGKGYVINVDNGCPSTKCSQYWEGSCVSTLAQEECTLRCIYNQFHECTFEYCISVTCPFPRN